MGSKPEFGGRVVVITGATRGLGRAMAMDLASRGAHIVVASRKAQACQDVADEITARGWSRPLAVPCHVGRWSDCTELIETAKAEFGHLDVLINNAGMSPQYPSLTELSEELVDKVLAVNLKGPLRLSILAADAMTAGGSIVNISSIAAVQPASYDLPYAMAKAGLNTMTIGLAKSLGPRVRVNAIMAGPFATDISAAWNDDTRQRVATEVTMGRAGNPEEIIGAVRYLAGQDAGFTTGAILKVDGGMAWSPA
jgi:NAD(P)-dependent dehydrogenase (short-subunit alcohol dehydrogenase family)